MKALLLLSLLSLSAAAEQLPSSPTLRVDLDGDGVADLVEIRPLNAKFSRLTVKLSTSGETYTFDRLARAARNDNELGCSSMNFHTLSKGRVPGTFVWTETYGAYDGCAGQLDRSLVIRKGLFGLEVTEVVLNSQSYSAGDPSPFYKLRIDLVSGVAKQRDFDEHQPDDISHEKLQLPGDCGPLSLVAFERELYPACVKAAAVKLKFNCGRLDDQEVCPSPGNFDR